MSEALVRLLLLSLAGSLLALLLYLLQPLLERIVTRRILYVLWIIVMVRMVVPVGIASVGTGAFVPHATPTSAVTQSAPTAPAATSTPHPTQPSTTATTVPTKSEATPTPVGSAVIGGGTSTGGGAIVALLSKVSDAVDGIVRSVLVSVTPLSTVLLGIWLLGALVGLSFGSVRHRRILRAIRREARPASPKDVALLDACRAEFGIRQPVEMIRAASVPTPILSGIVRPLLCLPEREFTAEELRLVLHHELMHLKHHDLLVKRIALWVSAVHWFNPAVHLIRHELTQAAELACDESVSSRLEKVDRKRYGEVLLQQAAQRPYPPFSGTQSLSESGRRLGQRLKVIAQMKAAPRRKRVAGLAVLLLLLVVPLPQFAPIALTGCTAPAGSDLLNDVMAATGFQYKVWTWGMSESDFLAQNKTEPIVTLGSMKGIVIYSDTNRHAYSRPSITMFPVFTFSDGQLSNVKLIAEFTDVDSFAAAAKRLKVVLDGLPAPRNGSTDFLEVVPPVTGAGLGRDLWAGTDGSSMEIGTYDSSGSSTNGTKYSIVIALGTSNLRTATSQDVEAAWKAVGLDVVRQSTERADLALDGVVPVSYTWTNAIPAAVHVYICGSAEKLATVVSAYDSHGAGSDPNWSENPTLVMRMTEANLMIVAACGGSVEDANDFFRLIQVGLNRLDNGASPTSMATGTTTPAPTPHTS